MRRYPFSKLFLILFVSSWVIYTPVSASGMDLVGLLTSQLGVSTDQAQGGAGSIFQKAKENLSVEDFSSVAKAVPGIGQMMGAAPKTEESAGALGGLSSMMGGGSDKLQGLAGLAGSFKDLGMSGDMVGKFTPIILDYVKSTGGDQVMNLLKGAL